MRPSQQPEVLRRFVRLLVHQGCNVQPGQHVLLVGEPSALQLLEWACEACYERGARFVDHALTVPRLDRCHVRGAGPQGLTFVPGYKTVQMDQLVDSGGALLTLLSQDEPDLYEDFAPAELGRVNEMRVARRQATRRLLDEGILQSRVAWCGAGPPSPRWASKVFPELPPEQAVEALWDDILAMTFAVHTDCEERWSRHLARLAERARVLSERQIRELRFVNPARDTDLTVRLSPRARWVGGPCTTAQGVTTCPNIPTYEVFTTPDWRGTEGRVGMTRPVMINGSLVEGLRLRFEAGQLVEAQAGRNLAAYEALINTDPTARRLGEVALVGVDSPIFQSGRIYQHTLYDENAACHIATGMAYTAGLHEGERLSPEALDELGCTRQARTHQDVMISDEHTTVYADGQEILVQGRWLD